MIASQTGIAATPHAQRYVRQLANHWGHRFKVDHRDGGEHVDFGDGSGVVMSVGDELVELAIFGRPDDMAMLRGVVEEHVDRFAFREGGLAYHWGEVEQAEPQA